MIKDRLVLYLKTKHISKSEFGRKIGVSSAYITSMRQSISPKKIKSIALNYPDLNIDWLITGNGNMLRENKEGNHNQSITGDFNTQTGSNNINDLQTLKSQLEELYRLLREKDERIKEKDAQLKEKDTQINKLLSILSK